MIGLYRISRFSFVANHFWNKTAFATVKDMKVLRDMPSTYQVRSIS